MNRKVDKDKMVNRAISSAMERITCIRCKTKTVYVTPKGAVGKLCSQCFLIALSEFPNPDCEYCYGEGEYYGHSENCADELCCLAGGYHDCKGRMIACDCSFSDNLPIFKEVPHHAKK